jgi:GxxExxY protein
MNENELSRFIVDISFSIHKQYGPGLYESVYEELFCYEWSKLNIPFKRQHPIPLIHEELKMQIAFRANVMVGNKVIIELKSIEALGNIHYKQLQTYLKLSGLRLGMLINFNVPLIKNGIHRVVNNL